MLLEISDHKSIGSLQREFAVLFPFLRITFFAGPYYPGNFAGGLPFSGRKLIRTVRLRHNNGGMEVHPRHTASHIEKCFRERFGLFVQVYRRSGQGWLPVTYDDKRTLVEHNDIGQGAAENESSDSGKARVGNLYKK